MNSVSPTCKLDAPKSNEVEISLFGPSYGECVTIHVGGGIWFVVDSCTVPGTGKSRPLGYFESIGVDVSTAVKKIIVTHWDDDHIRGLSELLNAATGSDLVISGALLCKEFLTLVRLYDNAKLSRGASTKELAKALAILVKAGRQPVLAQEQMTLWNTSINGQEFGSLVSLSPSIAEIIQSKINISKMLEKGVLSDENRNERSIVLWLKIGAATMLLGSDMLNSTEKDRGWSAILLSKIFRQKAQVFKVPHHGSITSHNDKAWSDLLEPLPPAILAPWRKGNHALPTRTDIERIQKVTNQLYVTTIPQNKKHTRPSEVDRIIRSTAKNIRMVDQTLGHIRLRINCDDEKATWSIDLFNGARKIEARMAKAFSVTTG